MSWSRDANGINSRNKYNLCNKSSLFNADQLQLIELQIIPQEAKYLSVLTL